MENLNLGYYTLLSGNFTMNLIERKGYYRGTIDAKRSKIKHFVIGKLTEEDLDKSLKNSNSIKVKMPEASRLHATTKNRVKEIVKEILKTNKNSLSRTKIAEITQYVHVIDIEGQRNRIYSYYDSEQFLKRNKNLKKNYVRSSAVSVQKRLLRNVPKNYRNNITRVYSAYEDIKNEYGV